MSAGNVGAGGGGALTGGAVLWEAALSAALGSAAARDGFKQLVCRQMMGLVLLVYARHSIAPACQTPPRLCSVGTGFAGILGNKVRFLLSSLGASRPPDDDDYDDDDNDEL